MATSRVTVYITGEEKIRAHEFSTWVGVSIGWGDCNLQFAGKTEAIAFATQLLAEIKNAEKAGG
jgi:hypothetical protein